MAIATQKAQVPCSLYQRAGRDVSTVAAIAKPYKIVSLLDMEKIGEQLYELGVEVNRLLQRATELEEEGKRLSDDGRAECTDILFDIERRCRLAELERVLPHIERMQDSVENDSTYNTIDLKYDARQVNLLTRDELGAVLLLGIPREKAKYYEQDEAFGDDVADNFYKASYDIREAGNCLATGRDTACVMHLMRALEVALDALGAGVGLPGIKLDAKNSWGGALRLIKEEIKRKDKLADPEWMAKSNFFTETHERLSSVKTAFRDSSMHLEKQYSPHMAADIFASMKSFMSYLAEHLDEDGNYYESLV